MKASELIRKLQDITDHYKTLYVMGCIGAPLTGTNVTRYCANHSYNQQASRMAMIKATANQNPPVYGFDCVCLIKSVLWGWSGDTSKTYGGAVYASNGVPDIGADQMITKCTDVSTDFKTIIPGEAVWMSGHIGVYIGNGKVIECSPAFKNCVQITVCLNIGTIAGMNGRKWTKHGKLLYITYDTEKNTPAAVSKPSSTFAVGDVVQFTGNKHYASADSATGPECKPGPAKITAISNGDQHPYHLIHEKGGGSMVYGWVDVVDMQPISGNIGTSTALKMGVGVRVQYDGPLYGDSYGNGKGKTVSGTYTVKRYCPGRTCGVQINELGWVPESDCKIIN